MATRRDLRHPDLTSASPPGGAVVSDSLEVRITRTGDELLRSLGAVLQSLPDPPTGPQALARRLGIDKVLASRVLKALRAPDPITLINRAPGPEPLRRLVKAAGRHGADPASLRLAGAAVDNFEKLIRDDIGDRSALDAIVSAWVPEARREFELRRKQAAFKATSQLRGSHAEALMATVLLHPSDDGRHLDIVWINGLFALQRLRPGAPVRLTTRRTGRPEPNQRMPRTLTGEELNDEASPLLHAYCSQPTPTLNVQRVGDVVHYTLAGDDFGSRSAVDLVFGEVNLGEIRATVPAGSGRRGYVFAEVSTPTKVLQFDALIHERAYPGSDPELRMYDTAFEGVADVNNPVRDIDRLDMLESVERMGAGLMRFHSSDVPRYLDLLAGVCERLNWNPAHFRGYRCRIDYPIYGTQIAMAFRPPEA